MRTPLAYAALLALSASFLAGCSSQPLENPADPLLPSPSVDMKLGQATTLYPADGSDAQMTFAVDKIEVDPQCGQHGSQPAGTHTVVLHVRVSTGTLVDGGDSASLAKRIDPLAFRAGDAAGNLHASQSDTCTDPAAPIVYASNSNYWSRVSFSTDTAPVEVALPSLGSRGGQVLVWKV